MIIMCETALLCFIDDDDDPDVLDPARIALPCMSQQTMQPPTSRILHLPGQQQQQQQCQAPTTVQAALDKPLSWHAQAEELHDSSNIQADPAHWPVVERQARCGSEGSKELIRMSDPLFATLSERKQKLMALEEILLTAGIEG